VQIPCIHSNSPSLCIIHWANITYPHPRYSHEYASTTENANRDRWFQKIILNRAWARRPVACGSAVRMKMFVRQRGWAPPGIAGASLNSQTGTTYQVRRWYGWCCRYPAHEGLLLPVPGFGRVAVPGSTDRRSGHGGIFGIDYPHAPCYQTDASPHDPRSR
jgi:hypothetical protein